MDSGKLREALLLSVRGMNKTTELEPNVTTEQGLRALGEEGHTIEVLCKADSKRKGPSWHGLWIMRTVGIDGL